MMPFNFQHPANNLNLMSEQNSPKPQEERGQTIGSVIKSVAASMIGVQSSKKHEEDFAKGKPSTYIIMGLVATFVFILAIWGMVKLVSSLVTPQ